jgi:hypothetical protein
MLGPDEAKKIGRLPIKGFITENVTYRYYAKTEKEADYLVGVLNSSVVNEAIKPFQSQGLMGERDIHRRPFEVCNIPLFEPKNELHQKIAKVSAAARSQLLSIVPKMVTPVATARGDARRIVHGKLNQLDELVARLLNGQRARYPDHKSQAMKLLELFEH